MPTPELMTERMKVVAWRKHLSGAEWKVADYVLPESEELVLKSDVEAALQSALNDKEAEIQRLKKDAERLPADLPTRIQVSYSPDDWDTFIFGISGQLTMEALTAINASIHEDAEALFDKGPGEYLLSASHFKGQYGFEGRCEFAPGWELSVESFVPLDAAIDAMKGDA